MLTDVGGLGNIWQHMGGSVGVKCESCNLNQQLGCVTFGGMSDTAPNTELARLVRDRRLELGITQEDLAKALGKSRYWVIQVEKGVWNNGGIRVSLPAQVAVDLAVELGLDKERVLLAAGVEFEKWPNLSHISSNGDKLKILNITSLTPRQQAIIESAVHEYKRLNQESDT